MTLHVHHDDPEFKWIWLQLEKYIGDEAHFESKLGDRWQYMGTVAKDEVLHHQLRHRNVYDVRRYVDFIASKEYHHLQAYFPTADTFAFGEMTRNFHKPYFEVPPVHHLWNEQ